MQQSGPDHGVQVSLILSLFILLSAAMLTVAHRNTVRSLKDRNHTDQLGRSNGAVLATSEASQFTEIARLLPFQYLLH